MRFRVDPNPNGAHTVLAHEFTCTSSHLDGERGPIFTTVLRYQLPDSGETTPLVGKHILSSERV
jgi:hypothetical protein